MKQYIRLTFPFAPTAKDLRVPAAEGWELVQVVSDEDCGKWHAYLGRAAPEPSTADLMAELAARRKAAEDRQDLADADAAMKEIEAGGGIPFEDVKSKFGLA